ncbi:SufS family cysteine desulfurase [Candidatus Micrarchaeota archaeon]|nr:SufS family cysteine desulfurase [Candidatus Micrarchaeota archaeon]
MIDTKKDFPIFKNNPNLIYLDNAATTQKPSSVLDAERDFYENHYSNVHRGVYQLSQEATELYENARESIAEFLNASPEEIIFTRNATESINLVANILPVSKNDKIVSTLMNHHSNFVPWQLLSQKTKAKIEYLSLSESAELDVEDFNKLKNATVFAFTHASNATGVITPAKQLIEQAKDAGALTVIDAAQSAPHLPIDVKKLDCDFLALSGHKMLGPTGIGVLYGKKELLQELPPFLTGGDMIREVTIQETTWNDLPYKYEAGTPNISGAIGLAEAVRYLQRIGFDELLAHERDLTSYAHKILPNYVDVYGPAPSKKLGILSFNVQGVHAHDVASILDSKNIAIRSGHHCTQPLLNALGLTSTCRASFYVYNNKREVQSFVDALELSHKTLVK